MEVYSLLASIDDELAQNVYVKFVIDGFPEMQTKSAPVNEWLAKDNKRIFYADVMNLDIKTDKNYGYLMFTVFISM